MKILVVDFGSQYTHLIYHKTKYYLGHDPKLIDYHDFKPKENDYSEYEWVVLSGGPGTIEDFQLEMNWTVEKDLEDFNVLGICFGAQLLAKEQGYNFEKKVGEYGSTKITFVEDDIEQEVWMSHEDFIVADPDNKSEMHFVAFNKDDHPVAWEWFNEKENMRIGVQFHPEVDHTQHGLELLSEIFDDTRRDDIQSEIGNNLFTQLKTDLNHKIKADDRLFLAISGGVDSSTLGKFLSTILNPAQLRFYLVDNGLMRKNEVQEVFEVLSKMLPKGVLELINAQELFLDSLSGVEDPEKKRKIIGHAFIDVFSDKIKKSLEEEPLQNGGKSYFVQGTIWPDVIESGKTKMSKTIKSHHNVGGLPDDLPCTLLEPFRELYKNDIRMIADLLEIPSEIRNRHPFPGPGLAIRILGSITKEKVEIVQEADAILRRNLKEKKLENQVWQAGAILLPIKSVGVKGDNRSYEEVIVLRLVDSNNGMTASPSLIAIEALVDIGNQIQSQVKGVNRVVYDLSSKPPATIEWE